MEKLKERQKLVLREMVNFTCEKCHKHEDIVGKLIPHRIKRKSAGGKYIPRNILMVCKDCHKKLHGNEFRNIQGK